MDGKLVARNGEIAKEQDEVQRLSQELSSNKEAWKQLQEKDDRDASLNPPRLILPSLQINLRNGAMPPEKDNGVSYLKLPLNVLGKDDHA